MSLQLKGKEFRSEAELINFVKDLSDQDRVAYAMYHTKPDEDNPVLGYESLVVQCPCRGKHTSKSEGKRTPKPSMKVGCPYVLRIERHKTKKSTLVVASHSVTEHNEACVEQHLKKQERLDAKNMSNNKRQTGSAVNARSRKRSKKSKEVSSNEHVHFDFLNNVGQHLKTNMEQLSKDLMVQKGEDVAFCGSLQWYDSSWDTVKIDSSISLKETDLIFHSVKMSEDPIIIKLSKTEGNVFATDSMLAKIISCSQSGSTFDIAVEKIGKKLFFDFIDGEPPQEDGNSSNFPRNMAADNSCICRNLSQQIVDFDETPFECDEPNPFTLEEEQGRVASVAYRYRKWDLNNGIVLIARCEHDAVMQGPNNETQFLTIKALNECDSELANGIEWRRKLDTQPEAVLADELRSNPCELTKWTVQALLAGSDILKIGFVSRGDILGLYTCNLQEYTETFKENMDVAWRFVRHIVDECIRLDDGKYVVKKIPNVFKISISPLINLTNTSETKTGYQPAKSPIIVPFEKLNKVGRAAVLLNALGINENIKNVINGSVTLNVADINVDKIMFDTFKDTQVNVNVLRNYVDDECFDYLRAKIEEQDSAGYICKKCRCEADLDVIGCELCLTWEHFSCNGLTSERVDDAKWYCSTCRNVKI